MLILKTHVRNINFGSVQKLENILLKILSYIIPNDMMKGKKQEVSLKLFFCY